MKFNQTLTKISEAMITPSTTSAVAPTAVVNPTTATTAAQTTLAPVQNNTAKINELQNLIKSLPNTHPEKPVFLNQLKELQQTEKIKDKFKTLQNLSGTPKLEKTTTHFYDALGKAYAALNEAGPNDPTAAAAPVDAALPQPPASAQQAAPAPTPQDVDAAGETSKLENDSNKIALVGIITRILNELLKHQNEVITNPSTEPENKESASRRSLALKQLIDTTTSENLATSKLNDLLQHIQSQFSQIYPVS